jgi:hypothetical protein
MSRTDAVSAGAGGRLIAGLEASLELYRHAFNRLLFD